MEIMKQEISKEKPKVASLEEDKYIQGVETGKIITEGMKKELG